MNTELTEPILDRSPSQAPSRAPYNLAPSRLEPASAAPLYRQIYDALRRDLLEGRLEPGRRLAATRVMADTLAVSRNTVLEAIEQLAAEGYVESRAGSGTFATRNLPDDLLQLRASSPAAESIGSPGLSKRGESYRPHAEALRRPRAKPFTLGRPAIDQFPWPVWWRLMTKRGRELPREWLDYTDPQGYPPLRRALARYLHDSRGLDCDADQILIVRGSQQGLDLAARVLLDPGDAAWVEDPGYSAARIVLAASGAELVPVPIDGEGLDVETGRRLDQQRAGEPARLAYVTPSHQFPLGITMSLSRRLELLRWAHDAGAWIIEDDYDSEFRFVGRPHASLAGLDGGGHVLYLGTLSKVLFPALRLGYLVVPPEYVDAFAGARYASDRHTGLLEQAVIADFFDDGHFERHIRRMRQLYAERQQALSGAIKKHLEGAIDLQPSPAGLHDIGWLAPELDDADITRRAEAEGTIVSPLSSYRVQSQEAPTEQDPAQQAPALLFGYAGFPADELEEAVRRLARVFEDELYREE